MQEPAMELLIDIGNTSLKWTLRALPPSGDLEPMRSLRHHGGLPIDLHAVWEEMPMPVAARVSSVGAPTVARALASACRARWGLEPHFVQPRAFCRGLTIAYAEPGRLGVDRWLALLAAHQICDQPALILDAGTAITYDLLLPDGHHLGGLILPGVETLRQAILANTQIPPLALREVPGAWGRDTATAIVAASLEAPAALAERLLRRLAREAGAEPILLITGGDAEQLQARIEAPARHVPDLVLQGLTLVPEA